MLNKLKPTSEFSRNVLTLMTGTTIAQAIPIAISPILTRIYTPEDFGVFALFIAATSIFGSIANGKYELAIMLPKKDEDAINIFALGFIINITISLSSLLIIIVFHDYILKLLNNQEISHWLYFIPFSIFLIGCFNLLNYFNTRIKQYKDLAKTSIYKSIAASIIQLSLGFLKAGALGLISGQIISQIVSNTKLFLNVKKLKLFKHMKKIKIIALAKKYKKFPLFSLPNAIVDGIREQGFNILLPIIFSMATLGQFYLAQRMLKMPISVIAGSISQVLLQKMSVSKSYQLYELYISFLKKSVLVSALIFLMIYFFSVDIFTIIFGENWKLAGEIASILSPWMFLSFITTPLANIFIILQKQEVVLLYAIIYAIIPISLILFSENDFIAMIKLLSFLMTFVLVLFLIHIHITLSILRSRKNDAS